MQVKVSLSEQVRRAALAQGRELPAAATVAVDLGALPEGLRAAAAPHLPLDDGEHLKVWRPCVYGSWVSPVDPADVVALMSAWLTDRLAGEEKREANDAEMAAANAREAAKISGPPPVAEAEAASPLSPREEDVLREIARGASNKEIARTLDIAETTVKIHVQHILRKLGLSSRVQAAVYASDRLR